MKKIFGAAALIVGLSVASCGGGGRTTVEGGLDSLFSSEQADTVYGSGGRLGNRKHDKQRHGGRSLIL